MYRPHDVPGDLALSADQEAALASADCIAGPGIPWTAQVRQWYRGPSGSFALVVQDTGRDERLLRARQARLTRAFERPSEGSGSAEPTLQPFELDGLRGFRTCLPAQGLCKVVVPLQPGAAARFNAILMGPPEAPDAAYAELISAVRRESLHPR